MVQQVALQRDPQCPGQNPWGFRFRCLFSGLAHPLLSVLLRPPSAGCWPFALHCVCRSNGILCCQLATFTAGCLHSSFFPPLFGPNRTPKTASIRGHGHDQAVLACPTASGAASASSLSVVIFGISSSISMVTKRNETCRLPDCISLVWPRATSCLLPIWRYTGENKCAMYFLATF